MVQDAGRGGDAGERFRAATATQVAPLAEDLKVLNIMWDCGTERIFEDRRLQATSFRTQAERGDRRWWRRYVYSAQDQARLQDHRGHQPGLCLGPRLLGDLPQHAESVEAGRRRSWPSCSRNSARPTSRPRSRACQALQARCRSSRPHGAAISIPSCARPAQRGLFQQTSLSCCRWLESSLRAARQGSARRRDRRRVAATTTSCTRSSRTMPEHKAFVAEVPRQDRAPIRSTPCIHMVQALDARCRRHTTKALEGEQRRVARRPTSLRRRHARARVPRPDAPGQDARGSARVSRTRCSGRTIECRRVPVRRCSTNMMIFPAKEIVTTPVGLKIAGTGSRRSRRICSTLTSTPHGTASSRLAGGDPPRVRRPDPAGVAWTVSPTPACVFLVAARPHADLRRAAASSTSRTAACTPSAATPRPRSVGSRPAATRPRRPDVAGAALVSGGAGRRRAAGRCTRAAAAAAAMLGQGGGPAAARHLCRVHDPRGRAAADLGHAAVHSPTTSVTVLGTVDVFGGVTYTRYQLLLSCRCRGAA